MRLAVIQFLSIVILIFPLSAWGKIRHPIKIPDFDDNDSAEFFSLDGSISNFIYNPGAYNARPDLTGTAFNHYYLDAFIETGTIFVELESSFLTDKDAADRWSTLSEWDKDVTMGYHLNDILDFYVEYEHDSPFNSSFRRSYMGAGVRYNLDSEIFESELTFVVDIEKVLKNNYYASRPDGTGESSMIYMLHLDYDLPKQFSVSIEHHLYTDRDNTFTQSFVKGSEWDQIYQLNYQFDQDLIISIFDERDTFLDQSFPSQHFQGIQLLYEF